LHANLIIRSTGRLINIERATHLRCPLCPITQRPPIALGQASHRSPVTLYQWMERLCATSARRGVLERKRRAKKRPYQTKPVENGVPACSIRTYDKMPSKKRSQLKPKRSQLSGDLDVSAFRRFCSSPSCRAGSRRAGMPLCLRAFVVSVPIRQSTIDIRQWAAARNCSLRDEL